MSLKELVQRIKVEKMSTHQRVPLQITRLRPRWFESAGSPLVDDRLWLGCIFLSVKAEARGHLLMSIYVCHHSRTLSETHYSRQNHIGPSAGISFVEKFPFKCMRS